MLSNWMEWGCELIVWIQSLPEWLTPIMLFFSFLGSISFYLMLLPLSLWCLDVGLGLRLSALLLTSGVVNGTLKAAFGLPRPYWVCPKVEALTTDSSFGLPSGHAQNSLALWSRLMIAIPGVGSFLLGSLMFLLISISRIYLGVHFPLDTLAGWGFGLILLFIFLCLENPVIAWLKKRRLAIQLLAVTLFGLLLLSVGLGISLLAYNPVPPAWIADAALADPSAEPIDPRNPMGILAAAGTLLGVGLGGVLLVHWGGFSAKGPVWKRLLRYTLGLASSGVIYFGLSGLLADGESPLGYASNYLLFVFIGFWITYLAPRIFVWLKLTENDMNNDSL